MQKHEFLVTNVKGLVGIESSNENFNDMYEFKVVVEKTENGFLGYCNGEFSFKVKSPNIELLRREVNREISGILQKKIEMHKYINYSHNLNPRVHYIFDVQKLLHDIQPYIKFKTLAEHAGITNVTLSYYLHGHKSSTEKNFMKLVKAIQAISLKLQDLSFS